MSRQRTIHGPGMQCKPPRHLLGGEYHALGVAGQAHAEQQVLRGGSLAHALAGVHQQAGPHDRQLLRQERSLSAKRLAQLLLAGHRGCQPLLPAGLYRARPTRRPGACTGKQKGRAFEVRPGKVCFPRVGGDAKPVGHDTHSRASVMSPDATPQARIDYTLLGCRNALTKRNRCL